MTHFRPAGLARERSAPSFAASILFSSTLLWGASAHAQTTAPGYSLTPFATGTPIGASNPDSIAISGGNVFIGYANNSDSAGGLGFSTIAQYTTTGTLQKSYVMNGGNDGLRVDPSTGLVWVLQNQDGNSVLNVLNPANGFMSQYGYAGNAHPDYSGYDDIVFSGGTAYLSATNPADADGTVLYSASTTLPATSASSPGLIQLTPVLKSGKLSDTDSLAISPDGKSLLLDDQGGNGSRTDGNISSPSLTIVSIPGGQVSGVINLKDARGNALSSDDTRFAPTGSKTMLIADTNKNTIYALSGPFTGNGAYTATKGNGFAGVGSLDLTSGVISPVVSGLGSPHGLAFIPAAPEPSQAAALGIGLLGLAGLAVKARRRSNETV